MKTLYTFIFLAIALSTGACSGDKSNSSSKQENVFKAQTDALNKAKQVESTVMKQAEQEKQAIDQQTR